MGVNIKELPIAKFGPIIATTWMRQKRENFSQNSASVIKTFSQPEEANFLRVRKGTHKILQWVFTLNGEILSDFPLKSEREGCLLTAIQYCGGGFRQSNTARKRKKS